MRTLIYEIIYPVSIWYLSGIYPACGRHDCCHGSAHATVDFDALVTFIKVSGSESASDIIESVMSCKFLGVEGGGGGRVQ